MSEQELKDMAVNIAASKSAIDTGLATITKSASALDEAVAKFKEAVPKAEKTDKETKVEEIKVEEAGALTGITRTEIWGVPIGQVAIGTFGGVFINEVVSGFLAKQSTMVQGAAKLGMAGLVGTWGRRWMSKDASFAIAFVLGVFGLSQILPIDKWATNAAGTIRGFLPGTIRVTGMDKLTGLREAEIVANRYSGGILGRKG